MIVYLHGFGSAGGGPKPEALVDAFGTENVISPTLPVNPDEVETIVTTIVRDVATTGNWPLIFVGTSLGGFWANYFAQKWDSPCVIINPSTSPSKSLARSLNCPFPNFVTGHPVIVTNEDLEGFKLREDYLLDNTNGSLINLFLAQDDELLPPAATLSAIPYYASCEVTETGGHRYATQFYRVVDKLKSMLDNEITRYSETDITEVS